MNTKNKVKISPQKQFELDMEKLWLNDKQKESDKQYKVALREIQRLRKQNETLLDLKGQVNTYSIKRSKGVGGQAVAFAIASDWHVEENVKPVS